MPETCTIVFAKSPTAGVAKTRLIPALGAEGAALLAKEMLWHTLTEALAADIGHVILACTPAITSPEWQAIKLPGGIETVSQPEGDLGHRLHEVSASVLQRYGQVLVVGTDCPALDAKRFQEAATALDSHDVVMHPAKDGGYVLLGFSDPQPVLFKSIPWSSALVAERTLTRCEELDLSVRVLETLRDIDEPTDLSELPDEFPLPASVA